MAHYEIQVRVVGAAEPSWVNAGDVLSYNSTSLDSGTEYEARVRRVEDEVASDPTAWVQVTTNDIFEGTSKVQGTGSIQTAGHKKSVQDSQLELVGSVQVAGHKKSVQDSQLELVGSVQVAGHKKSVQDSQLELEGQIMTTGIAALLDLGIPQNVQAVGISLSEIQLSWDEVLSTDGYEYRFREKVL